jgi:hypothetical protein
MRIYFTATDNPKIIGFAQAIEKLINEAFFVNLRKQNIFDFIEISKPDLIFVDSSSLDYIYIDYVKAENPNIKICLIKDKPTDPKFDHLFDYIINAFNEKEENFMPFLHNDVMITDEGKFDNKFDSDFIFISNTLKTSMDINNILNLIGDNFNLKIIGKHKVNSPYYIGNIGEADYNNVFKSTKAIISLNDEWDMTCLSSEILPISFNIKDEKKEYQWNNTQELFSICKKVVNKTQEFKIEKNIKTYKDYAKMIIEEMKL